MPKQHADIVVIGAGIAGIATAYYLCTEHGRTSVLLIDPRTPMSFTSAQSGDNYRNWWPHPTMVEFTNRSIDLMERIARESNNVLNMTRRGYVLATRKNDIDDLLAELHRGYSGATDSIRHHASSSSSYLPALDANWMAAPEGVDVLAGQDLIRTTFPSFDPTINNVLHIRRAGDIDSQQLGQYMLDRIKQAGGQRLTGRVVAIEQCDRFVVETETPDGIVDITADHAINAAGPFAKHIADMLDVELPINNVFQQKIAFPDAHGAIPRQLPFSIDLDQQTLNWSAEERALLGEDEHTKWLLDTIPGATHCRPDGSEQGDRVKLGWAYNHTSSEPQQELRNEPLFDPYFPEIVMRGAAALNPSLACYVDSMPTRCAHYGGYYPMTDENWPLIGPLANDGALRQAYVVGALSGFGSMAACAAGELCAAWVSGNSLPDHGQHLSLARYANQPLMDEISLTSKGIL